MKISTAMICIFGLALLAGCGASSEITQSRSDAAQERIPLPGRIIVYDIGATPGDVPPTAAITGHYSDRRTPQTEQEIQLGRRLGAQVADGLVRKILDMGLPAQRAGNGPPPQLGDILITGQFITIDEGRRGKRVLIVFGRGGGELSTHVAGYLITPSGQRLLGTREVTTAGGKSPGLALPGIVAVATSNPAGLIINSALKVKKAGAETIEGAAKRTTDEIANELRIIFKRQGWI